MMTQEGLLQGRGEVEPENEMIVVIDVGTSKTSAIAGTPVVEETLTQKEEGAEWLSVFAPVGVKFKVNAYAIEHTVGMSEGRISNIYFLRESVKSVLNRLAQKLHKGLRHVYVSVSGSVVQFKNEAVEIQLEDKKFVDNNHLDELRKRILRSADSDNYVYLTYMIRRALIRRREYSTSRVSEEVCQPGKIVGEVGESLRLEYIKVLLHREAYNLFRVLADRCGLTVDGLVFQPAATAAALMKPEYENLDVMLVDVGGGTTDVLYFSKGELMGIDVIRMGGMDVTKDLATMLKIPFAEAERLKIEVSESMQDKQSKLTRVSTPSLKKPLSVQTVREIVDARYEEITELIFNRIKLRTGKQPTPDTIIITGGGALWAPFSEMLKYRFKPEHIVLGGADSWLAGGEKIDYPLLPQFTTAIGMLVRVFVYDRLVKTYSQYVSQQVDRGLRNLLTYFLQTVSSLFRKTTLVTDEGKVEDQTL